jgi:suppressor for copper-sensitivity B
MFTHPFDIKLSSIYGGSRRLALALSLLGLAGTAAVAAESLAPGAQSLPLLSSSPAPSGGSASAWSRNPQGTLGLRVGTRSHDPAEGIWLGLDFQPLPGWKIYWRSPGDAGFPPHVDWTGSDNLASAKVEWPAPRRFSVLGLETAGYEGEVVLPILAKPADIAAPIHLRAKIDYLTCSEICVPEKAFLDVTVPAGGASSGPDSAMIDRFRAMVPGNGAAAGLKLVSASATPDNGLKVVVDAEPPVIQPDLFVERPDQSPFGKPDIQSESGGRRVTFLVKQNSGAAPPRLDGDAILTVVDGDRSMEADVRIAPPPPADSTSLILTIVAVALLGGLILNVMPCVLPVLSIKLLGLVLHPDRDRRSLRANFIAQAAGILASFLVLAGATLAAKASGAAIGWGLQFQTPLFVVGLALVVTVFAANMFGFYEIRLPGWAGAAGASGAGRNGIAASFLAGAFATLLATPCSAPFLGTAIGFALARGPGEIVLIFAALGLGMALPYLAMAAWPGWVRWLPRPGAWMIRLRRVLGLALAGTAIWLLSVLAAEMGRPAALVEAVLLVTAMAVMADRRLPGKARAGAVILLGIATLAAPSVIPVSFPPAAAPTAHQDWQPFDRATISSDVAAGKVVFVDVTARWCVTCQVNKAAVIDRDPVSAVLGGKDVVAMRADWTRPDPAISDYLGEFNRYGIPFDAVYGPGAPNGIALPELLTTDALLSAIGKAGKPAS